MPPRLSRLLLCCFALCCFGLSGCLQRTISITTDPPGALVWLNDAEVGRTPLETDFTFYGDYDVRIEREGYEPIITHAKAKTPPQELPGVDLIAEAAPIRFHNTVRWHWDLTPVADSGPGKETAEQATIGRAKDLRAKLSPATERASEERRETGEPREDQSEQK